MPFTTEEAQLCITSMTNTTELRTVTHESRKGDTFEAAVTVTNVEVRWPDRKEQSGANLMQNNTGSLEFLYRAWEIGFIPREGDRINYAHPSAGNDVWLVQSVKWELLDQRIRITTNRGI